MTCTYMYSFKLTYINSHTVSRNSLHQGTRLGDMTQKPQEKCPSQLEVVRSQMFL